MCVRICDVMTLRRSRTLDFWCWWVVGSLAPYFIHTGEGVNSELRGQQQTVIVLVVGKTTGCFIMVITAYYMYWDDAFFTLPSTLGCLLVMGICCTDTTPIYGVSSNDNHSFEPNKNNAHNTDCSDIQHTTVQIYTYKLWCKYGREQ